VVGVGGAFQLVARPPDRDLPDWAAKIHLATAPVFYHNYLLGEILASQLRETAKVECGGLLSWDAGRLLVDRIFRLGASMRWEALVEEATGKALAATDCVRDFLSL
jgi:peptidyl-dipeptidase A